MPVGVTSWSCSDWASQGADREMGSARATGDSQRHDRKTFGWWQLSLSALLSVDAGYQERQGSCVESTGVAQRAILRQVRVCVLRVCLVVGVPEVVSHGAIARLAGSSTLCARPASPRTRCSPSSSHGSGTTPTRRLRLPLVSRARSPRFDWRNCCSSECCSRFDRFGQDMTE